MVRHGVEQGLALSELRGILFDLDLTLTDAAAAQAVWASVNERLGQPYDGFDADEFVRRLGTLGDRHYELLLRRDVDLPTYRRNFVSEALEPWGELDDELFGAYNDAWDRAIDDVRLHEDALETVRLLRADGLKVGVLTNGLSRIQRRKLQRLELEDELDAIAISEEIGAFKPDPAAFHAAVTMLGLQPRQVAMVGDHPLNDVAGALGAGLAGAVWV